MKRSLYTLPPGVDFAREIVAGLAARLPENGPSAFQDVEIYVNTHRMRRRLLDVFSESPAIILPKIHTVTDPANDPVLTDLPPPVSALRRNLELSVLIDRFLQSQPDLAPESALFPLCDSLSALLSEIHGEGVALEKFRDLDVSDESGHWARALDFFQIAADYAENLASGPDQEARLRRATEAQIARWQAAPPEHPVLLAGSTASRGTTMLLAEAIAGLPQGAVIFPGSDPHMSADLWGQLDAPLKGQDHPQYRLANLARRLGLDPASLPVWTAAKPANEARNRLVSLALRPAPVTDGWLEDGPKLTDLAAATEGLTLLEAPSPRIEAEAIALRLRDAAARGQMAALICPDRTLTRQVAAALDRWRLRPDDSAGTPLHHTAPGRLLLQTADFLAGDFGADQLLVLLKHPLTHQGAERGPHLRWTRELELHIRRYGPPYASAESMTNWRNRHEDAAEWADWVAGFLAPVAPEKQPLAALAARHFAMIERISAGPGEALPTIWEGGAGQMCRAAMAELQDCAPIGTDLTPRDYAALIASLLQAQEHREPHEAHPNILIWGTLEARVQSADMVILAGLNEGIWPAAPTADPWLNRAMRAQLGLLLPDRQIGLAAHDFQQAVAGREVWLSRAARSDEAETVPSRWVNRLTNLLEGLPVGKECLAGMRARGDEWVALAQALDRPSEPKPAASRPSPRPPVAARPRELRVTDIAQLLRDPYAIYAREVLGLSGLDPLIMDADARLRGIAIHKVMEKFVQQVDPAEGTAADDLVALSEAVLARKCPWPMARALWRAQMVRNAPEIVAKEITRRRDVSKIHVEATANLQIGPVRLRGRADRVDQLRDGGVAIYDYKTGAPPSVKQQNALDKQLLIETLMAERGGFDDIPAAPVVRASYLQIGGKLNEVAAPIDTNPPDRLYSDLLTLMRNWMRPEQGYTARIAAQSSAFGGLYDQLARYGEWDDSQAPEPEDVS